MPGDPCAGIVVIGNEILSAEFRDENSPFLIRSLNDIGVSVVRVEVIRDQEDEISRSVAALAAEATSVFTTGGVGPTHDDITMEGIAAAFKVPLEYNVAMISVVEGYFGGRLSSAQKRLALAPHGAEVIAGAQWRDAVVRFRNVYILPGVPALVRHKFGTIAERFRGPPFHAGRVFLSGDEASFKETLDDAVARHADVQFGSYPRFDEGEFQILITVKGRDANKVLAATEYLAKTAGNRVVRVEKPSI